MTTLPLKVKTASTPSVNPSKRLLRRIARGLGLVLAPIVGLTLAGAGYEALAARGDARAYPPPGQMVDVGGYRLHIQCVGDGGPTVVLDAGLGGTSLDWSLVQTELGQTTRVCAFDRAGLGWSESGPEPRTSGQNAQELHALLINAGIEGPYVLVGHSLAGKNVRMFALQYPDLVAGIVLVDARSELVDARTSPADARAFTASAESEANLYRIARPLGLVRLIGASRVGTPAMPAELRQAMALNATSPRALAASTAEARDRTADDARLESAPSLGDRPLAVIAAGQSWTGIANWPEAQQQLAGLSTRGRLIVVDGSSHYVHWDRPDVVIDAIRQVMAQVREP